MGEMTNEEVLDRLIGLARSNPPGSDDQPKAPEAEARAAVLARMAPEWQPIADDTPRDKPFLGTNVEGEQAVIRWDGFWGAWYSNGTRFFPTHVAALLEPAHDCPRA